MLRNFFLVIITINLLFVVGLTAITLEKGSEGLNIALELLEDSGEKLPVIIVLKDQVDPDTHYQSVKDLPKSERRKLTIERLKSHSAATQSELRKALDKLQNDKKVAKVKYFWISNIISADASLEALKVLDKRNDIERIEYDPEVKVIDDLEQNSELIPSDLDGSERAHIWNIEQMQVPEVWDLGISGGGVLVGVFDTGINYNHNDIRERMWLHPDYPNNGWDFFDEDNDPMDIYDHGTHCAGSVAGDGTSGIQTGIAPKSNIMALKTTSDRGDSQQHVVWNAIEFALDHGVDVFSMSLGWYQTMNVAFKTWRDIMVNVLSAGVPASLSAGNEAADSDKPVPLNIRVPGNCPAPWLHPDQEERGGVTSVLCIGASDSGKRIANFSSYGPATWQDVESYNDYLYKPSEGKMGLIKPDITAPGTNIVSLSNRDIKGYSTKQGTSMSCPNASGVITLMVSKNNDITPEDIARILEETAYNPESKKNNTYGSGIINALAAVSAVETPFLPNLTYDPKPKETATLVSLIPTLKWSHIGNFADSYKVSLGTDNPPTNVLHNFEVTEKYLEITEPLNPQTTYYWKVDSVNGSGVREGKVWHFTTGRPVSEGFETGNFSKYEWELTCSGSGSNNWTIDTEEVYRGHYSAKSGSISHGSSTTLMVMIEVLQAGQVTFNRKISSEDSFDSLIFFVDNVVVGQWSGELDWDLVSFPVSPGFRTLRWVYQKDLMNTKGSDAAWIDDIAFPMHTEPPVVYVPKSLELAKNFDEFEINWDIDLNVGINPNLFLLMGYNVYLGSSEDGEYLKVNDEILKDQKYVHQVKEEGEFFYHIKAVYRKMGKLIESEPSETIFFTINPAPDMPEFDPPAGEYYEPIEVTLSSSLEENQIFYTLDGSEPTLESIEYSEPISVDDSVTIKARVYKIGHLIGQTGTCEYIITKTGVDDNLVNPPVFYLKAFPNPLVARDNISRNEKTLRIEYILPQETDSFSISIYNIKGQMIRRLSNLDKSKGVHNINWNLKDDHGETVSSGFYLLKIVKDSETTNRKVLIIK